MAKKKKKKVTIKKKNKKKTTTSKPIAGEVGRWNGHHFAVSPKLIRGFTGLTIKGASDVEEKKKKKQVRVKRKNGKPTEVSFTIHLNAYVGVDVRKEALKFVDEARKGKKDYFYINNKKLVSCKLMLIEASVKEVEITPGGKWIKAEVQASMKQYGKTGKTVSGSNKTKSKNKSGKTNSGSNKASVRTSSPTTTSTSTSGGSKNENRLISFRKVSDKSPSTKEVKAGTSAASRIMGNAKKDSAAKKNSGYVVQQERVKGRI